jgi:hypothetical protein
MKRTVKLAVRRETLRQLVALSHAAGGEQDLTTESKVADGCVVLLAVTGTSPCTK